MYILYIVLWVISLCSFNHLIQHKDYLACEKKGGHWIGPVGSGEVQKSVCVQLCTYIEILLTILQTCKAIMCVLPRDWFSTGRCTAFLQRPPSLLSSVAAVPADVDVPRGREEASGGLGAKHHGPTERLELCQRPWLLDCLWELGPLEIKEGVFEGVFCSPIPTWQSLNICACNCCHHTCNSLSVALPGRFEVFGAKEVAMSTGIGEP